MKYSTISNELLIISFVLSLLGFLIDLIERKANISINLRDIFITSIFFGILPMYIGRLHQYRLIKKRFKIIFYHPRVGKNKT
jgi:ACR3 family arsenite efflux pump ArsB